MVGEIAKLGRADEREVGGVEDKYRPAARQARFGHGDELAGLEGGRLEGLYAGVDRDMGRLLAVVIELGRNHCSVAGINEMN